MPHGLHLTLLHEPETNGGFHTQHAEADGA